MPLRICLILFVLWSNAAAAEDLCDKLLKENLFEKLQTVNDAGKIKCTSGREDKAPRWKLVWFDEFDKDGLPDTAKWQQMVAGDGGGNGEKQYYTPAENRNAVIKNGVLEIQARKEKYQNQEYTSARLDSKQSWTYGKFEFRAKVPKGQGMWPAIWMLPMKQKYGEELWIDNGEIDILEAVGREPGQNLTSLHTKDFNYWTGVKQETYQAIPTNATEFHTYAMEWLPGRADIYIDGKKVHTFKKTAGADWKKWPFDQDFRLIMNLAVGGDYAGDIDDKALPAKFAIDYVRVYAPNHPQDCQPGH